MTPLLIKTISKWILEDSKCRTTWNNINSSKIDTIWDNNTNMNIRISNSRFLRTSRTMHKIDQSSNNINNHNSNSLIISNSTWATRTNSTTVTNSNRLSNRLHNTAIITTTTTSKRTTINNNNRIDSTIIKMLKTTTIWWTSNKIITISNSHSNSSSSSSLINRICITMEGSRTLWEEIISMDINRINKWITTKTTINTWTIITWGTVWISKWWTTTTTWWWTNSPTMVIYNINLVLLWTKSRIFLLHRLKCQINSTILSTWSFWKMKS
jgi:hypothetical protein